MADPPLTPDFDGKQTEISPRRPIVPVATALTHVLRQLYGPGAPRDIVIRGDLLLIGRGRTCDVVIPSLELSRRHIAVRRDAADYVVEDLDSQNGVYLNGVRIHSAALRGGDTIQLGEVAFLYLEGM
jgi:pSer/pThr/pTyr-binding forkhead associated (FHA) protein